MVRYSIHDLERLSGIRSHTIRIWEKRYGILKPSRTRTNIRYYSNDDLRRLLNISVLSEHGMKISKISNQTDEQIHQEIIRLLDKTDKTESVYKTYIHSIMMAALVYDEGAFEKNWEKCVTHLGIHEAMTQVVYPLLNRVGLMWNVDQMNPAQEHFLSCLIEKKLIVATNEIDLPDKIRLKYLLFLHEQEDHSIPLLFSNYLLRSHGINTIYLGSRVPLKNLEQVFIFCKPTFFLTFFITKQSQQFFNKYLKQLKKIAPSCHILLGGNKTYFGSLKFPPLVKWIDSIEDFENKIVRQGIQSRNKKKQKTDAH